MTITETLKDVKFVVGADGQPTAALVDIAAWQGVVELLEEAEVALNVREERDDAAVG